MPNGASEQQRDRRLPVISAPAAAGLDPIDALNGDLCNIPNGRILTLR
jgi:hypothetical protein